MPAVDTAQGLSTAQAAQMLLRHGPNRLSARKRVLALQFLLHFRNPLVLVLLAALVPCYLATAECAKPWFYRRLMRS